MKMRFSKLAGAPLALAALAAFGASLPGDTPLVTDGALVVTAADFEGNMLRVPENRRAEFRMAYDRVASVVDNIYVTRAIAQMARDAGMDKDPAIQRRMLQVQEGVLADQYMRKLEKEAVPANLEGRARELYVADPAKFTSPELVHVQHILIDLNGRTKQSALERATKVLAEAKAGEDFLVLASRYSDEKDRRRLGGDLGYSAPGSFMEPLRKAIEKLGKKGELAGPIETEAGYHLVRFIDRKKPRLAPFEEVKKGIIAEETERLQKQRLEALIQSVRASPTVTIHRANVEKLLVPVDPEVVKKAMEKAAAEASKDR